MTRFRVGPTWAAYVAQRALLRTWLGALPTVAWSAPSALEGWRVLELAVNLAHVSAGTARVLDEGPSSERPMSLGDYTGEWQAAGAEIAELTVKAAARVWPDEVLAAWDRADGLLPAGIAELPDDLVVRAPRGPLKVGDFLATRVNELVVHSGDLSRSVPSADPAPVDRAALAVSCRMLTTIFGERNPGHSVEVRVPPFAAVQAIEGPRHTRGTPANVVETDPATWVLVATGRLPYGDAVASGLIKASGLRADLGAYLPLF